jgi:CRISPR/Cas system-associated protein Csm6
MMFKVLIIAVSILWMLTACKDAESQQAIKMEQTIFSIHDSVMPRMGEIVLLRKSIEQLIKQDSTAASADSLNTVLKAVIKADRDMMDWMHRYKSPSMQSDTAIPYLTNELKKVKRVEEQIKKLLPEGH